jgi:hypothetical protein
MSHHTWRLIDWFRDNQGCSQTRLAINSNLGTDVDVDRLLTSTQGLDIEIYTSQESTGPQAEYIRDGLIYQDWQHNVTKLLNAGRRVHFMCTINALCLPGLTQLLEQLVDWKKIYSRDRVIFTLNILRFPSFQSPLVLSDDLRTKYQQNLSEFMVKHKSQSYLHEHEWNHVQRLVDYLDVVKTPHSQAFDLSRLQQDFWNFYQQYDKRRGKNFATTFDSIMTEWYHGLSV